MQKDKFKDKLFNKLNEWKAEAEHLNVQLHLGIAELEDEFENQKKQITDWAKLAKEKTNDFKDTNKKQLDKLKSKLEELRVQATLGKAETKEAFKDQQENLQNTIQEAKQEVQHLYKESKEEMKEFLENSENKLDQLHTRLDLLKLKFHLGKKEVQVEWEEKKKYLSRKLHEVNSQIDNWKNNSEAKMEHFSAEMKEAWKHLKNSFKN